MSSNYELDKKGYGNNKMPSFQRYWRYSVEMKGIRKIIYKILFKIERDKRNIDWADSLEIGPGLFLAHVSGITINPQVKIGKNCNIHKGVTIGQENRGPRKGTPIIGDEVWIGINATIVGKVKIGNDVLIAPNSYVNFDVPDHSIVIGNPATIKHCDCATQQYINNKI